MKLESDVKEVNDISNQIKQGNDVVDQLRPNVTVCVSAKTIQSSAKSVLCLVTM